MKPQEILEPKLLKLIETRPDEYIALEKQRELPEYAILIDSMNEYAKQRAIAFAEWCDKNEFTQSSAGLWYSDLDGFKYIGYTTAELYDIFNNENQEK